MWLAAAHRGSNRRASSDTIVTRLGNLETGDGVLLTTYAGPVTNRVPASIMVGVPSHVELAQHLWDGLDADRRVLVAGLQPHDHLENPILRNAVD